MKKSVKIEVKGIVQGVGFRPYIHKLANICKLKGWVLNSTKGVTIELEGNPGSVNNFINTFYKNPPPLSKIEDIKIETIQFKNYKNFTIKESKKEKKEFLPISPDISVCNDCLSEIFDQSDRRYLYPFTNCTNCGPRFTIIKNIPYDRKNTTMEEFKMCSECKKEYEDINDRRYHAQPNACVKCGPLVTLVDSKNKKLAKKNKAIIKTAELLKKGKIIAIKGIGGYHLACDASNNKAVANLKKRKGREDKPLAIMSADINSIKKYCILDKYEEAVINHYTRPIVLLKKKPGYCIAENVAKGQNYLGVMLPYSPFHYILLNYLKKTMPALVMTSANYSDEPLTKSNNEAFEKLKNIADYFLIHDRKIHISCDDSVVNIINKKPAIIRRARGYVPYPITLPSNNNQVLACGAELKNTFCVTREKHAFVSQHIGDLKNAETLEHYKFMASHFLKFFRIIPEKVACDLHPDYLSARFAEEFAKKHKIRLVKIQHHFAHIAGCLADNNINEKVIGVAYDGAGLGNDNTIWGGEFLIADLHSFERAAHFKYLRLPGGDASSKNPNRSALSYLYSSFGEDFLKQNLEFIKTFSKKETTILNTMLTKEINSPLTSSTGRLFDAASSMLNICHYNSYEGQAAIELQMTAERCLNKQKTAYEYKLYEDNGKTIIDWRPIILSIVSDIKRGIPKETIAYKFHSTVSKFTVEVCLNLSRKYNINKIALSGGVFQNKLLAEMLTKDLSGNGFTCYTHHQVPANDAGISLGQAAISAEEK